MQRYEMTLVKILSLKLKSSPQNEPQWFHKLQGRALILLLAVHSRECIWQESRARVARDWASATLYTLAESSQFWSATRDESQARHETLWLAHHRPLKKRDLNEARHERRGYTRDPSRGECSHLHSRSRLVSSSLGESVQPAYKVTRTMISDYSTVVTKFLTDLQNYKDVSKFYKVIRTSINGY